MALVIVLVKKAAALIVHSTVSNASHSSVIMVTCSKTSVYHLWKTYTEILTERGEKMIHEKNIKIQPLLKSNSTSSTVNTFFPMEEVRYRNSKIFSIEMFLQ